MREAVFDAALKEKSNAITKAICKRLIIMGLCVKQWQNER